MSYLNPFERVPQFQELGDPDLFRQEIAERAKTATPEETERLLSNLERYSQAPDRNIELYTDPNLDTFCCAEVPAQKVIQSGEIVDDPAKKTYLIGVPFIYAAGKAPEKFLRGEILHERGHAEFSQFSMFERLRKLARQEGYDEGEIMSGINCAEDPRMERLVGGPLHPNEREQMFEKNRQLIIPSIAKGLDEMQPAEQFKFILKLEGLWNIYGKDLKDTPKPWSIDKLHPDVAKEFKAVESSLRKITGDATNPAMKVMALVEKTFVDNIWQAQKRLLDKYPPKKEEGKTGKGQGKGQPGQGEPQPGEPTEPLDPTNTDNWPPELKKIIEKFKNEHQKKLEQKADQAKADAEKGKENAENLAQEKHELLKTRDQFDTPEMRERYNTLSAEVSPITGQLKRSFKRFVPKVTEPGLEWGRKGGRYSERRRIMRAGSGHEKPMGKREHPEETALALQLLVDVSGSMYGQNKERIKNAIKACIAISEAAKDNNIVIEILANDEKNVSNDIRYQIKGFNEPYDGRTKSRIVQMMEAFGGDNKDADAIMAAVPRIRKRIQTLRAEADRVGSLIIDITDSTTQSPDTRDAVEQARKFSPMEGTAITPEGEIPGMVKFHFGPQSIIPRSLNEFPDAIQQILERHVRRLRPRQ
ncbi:MAG: hypothetical protein WC663_01665 [Patescibacteria group bacterium]|jgi:hypothetical protein